MISEVNHLSGGDAQSVHNQWLADWIKRWDAKVELQRAANKRSRAMLNGDPSRPYFWLGAEADTT